MIDQLMLIQIEESNKFMDDMNRSSDELDRFMREINQNIEFLNIVNNTHIFNHETHVRDFENMSNFH